MHSTTPTPLDQILALAQFANTERARELLGEIRRSVELGADVAPWVAAVQLARNLGALDSAVTYFLLHVLTETAVGATIDDDPVLAELGERMRAIEREDGLGEDDVYLVNDAPLAWQELNRKWERRFDLRHAELLRRLGEHTLAIELILRPDDFERQSHDGWRVLLEIPDDDDEAGPD